MRKRTTIEIDEDLLERAKRVLGRQTARETVEEALRLAADAGEGDRAERGSRQLAYLRQLKERADTKLLRSGEMWR